jgi:hypothetical protein
LVGVQIWWASKRDATALGRLASFFRAMLDQGPLELGDAGEDG